MMADERPRQREKKERQRQRGENAWAAFAFKQVTELLSAKRHGENMIVFLFLLLRFGMMSL